MLRVTYFVSQNITYINLLHTIDIVNIYTTLYLRIRQALQSFILHYITNCAMFVTIIDRIGPALDLEKLVSKARCYLEIREIWL